MPGAGDIQRRCDDDVKTMLSRDHLFLLLVLCVWGQECPVGKYGEQCQLNCSRSCYPHSGQDVHCNRQSGRCSEGCVAGRFGDQCLLSCSKNCRERKCSQQSGYCIGSPTCTGNNTGDFCETPQESCANQSESKKSQDPASTLVTTILISVFAIIIIIIIITIAVIAVFMKLRKYRHTSKNDVEVREPLNLGGMDTVTTDTVHQNQDTGVIVDCKEGQLRRVRDSLDQSLNDINKKGQHGMTPVMWAARRGHIEVLDVLVKKGADVSLVDEDGRNILYWACYGCNFSMVKHVLSLDKVDINSKGRDGRTPAMFVARQGHMKMFELLVSKGDPPSENDINNILILACWGGNVALVKYIISYNAVDINTRGQSMRTPLMAAAYRGNEEVFDLLVNKGADLTLFDDAGDNVLHVACLGGHVEIVRSILNLDKVDINSQGQYNRTPLMMAARRGEIQIFDLLVTKGAVSPVDDDGNNILHLASEGGHTEIVKYIINNNMVNKDDINARNRHNETAAMLAPKGIRNDVSHFLVSNGGHMK